MLKKEKIDFPRVCLTIFVFDIGVNNKGFIEIIGTG
jgi:hypothetical protein